MTAGQDKLEDTKNRKTAGDKRKRRQKRKKKINSAETVENGPSPQKPHNVAPKPKTTLLESAIQDVSENSKSSPPEPPSHANRESKQITPLNTEPLVQPPPSVLEQNSMSPRKQTLLRHKKGTDQASEPSFVSEAKEYKKHRKQHSANAVNTAETHAEEEDQKYSVLLSQQNLEGKASLFRCRAARILVYHEQIQDPVSQSSPGTLLGHGEFEIFQLHNGDVTYLACGRSFVYPLLPRLKILKIGPSQFILPLSNPERFWKINIDTEDMAVIRELETILQKLVKYTDLSRGLVKETSLPTSSNENFETATETQTSGPTPQTPEKHTHQNGNMSLPPLAENDSNHAGHVDSPNRASQYRPFFNDIPESPPSAPVSPQQFFEANTFQLSPARELQWPIQREKSDQSMTSAIASFSFTEKQTSKPDTNHTKLRQPKPMASTTLHANPHVISHTNHDVNPLANPLANPNSTQGRQSITHKTLPPLPFKQYNESQSRNVKGDNKSDTSSMDSLLDEYEENISTTKSINYNIPRSQSRTMSLASSAYPPAINYQRGKIPLVPDIASNRGSVTHEPVEDDQENENFFKTSLSQYNRAKQGTRSQRSRRSSPSELYNSVSNWMEPNVRIQPSLSHSRSNYSLSSAKNSVSSHRAQETRLRDIYRSITENNLHATLQQPNGRRQSVGSSREYGPRLKTNTLSAVSESHLRRGDNQSQKSSTSRAGMRSGKEQLSSTDVYRLVSARSGRTDPVTSEQNKRGSISRLFGW